MSLGPSRRSKNRALDSPSPSPGDTARAHFPDSPTGKSRYEPRRVGCPHTLGGKKNRYSLRRVPFIVWLASISIYSCIMYLSMESSRRGVRPDVSVPQGDSLKPKIARAQVHDNPTALNQDEGDAIPIISQSTPNELSATKEDDISTTMHSNTNANDARFGTEIVHVVVTRFMQQQSSLIELGLARLALFEAFCLAGMISQSNQDFIWIIRADPKLHPAIRGTMVNLLEGRQNFILMGSNSNPEGFGRLGGSFQDFLDPKGLGATVPVWSGNISMVEEAYAKSQAGAVLLETRLDADDALQMHFVETVQEEAEESLVSTTESNDLWRLWCIHSNMEWHPLNPFPDAPEVLASNKTMPEGFLILYSDKSICVTPGMTFGYGPGSSRTSLGFDRLRHDEIVKKVLPCKKDTEVKCVSRLTDLVPGTVRARTSTSAGMKGVLTGIKKIDKNHAIKRRTNNKQLVKQYFDQDQLWAGIEQMFEITRESPTYAKSVMLDRMSEIAAENLKGQCTAGHSCKKGTATVLGILAKEEE